MRRVVVRSRHVRRHHQGRAGVQWSAGHYAWAGGDSVTVEGGSSVVGVNRTGQDRSLAAERCLEVRSQGGGEARRRSTYVESSL